MKDNIVMFLGFLEEFKNTGSAFKSSKHAARALSNPLRRNSTPKNILEVGAGTGPVTVEIIRNMAHHDKLTVVEINPKFMKILRENIEKLPEYRIHKDRITLFEGPVQEVPEENKFDVIVCALPFLNFDMGLVWDIFRKFNRLAKENSVMTYYEYIGLRRLGKVVSKERKARLNELEKFFRNVGHQRLLKRDKVWLNLLPIYVYTLRLPIRDLEAQNSEFAITAAAG